MKAPLFVGDGLNRLFDISRFSRLNANPAMKTVRSTFKNKNQEPVPQAATMLLRSRTGAAYLIKTFQAFWKAGWKPEVQVAFSP